MSAWLNTFLEQPCTETPGASDSVALYCIIDTVRQPQTLRQLYQHEGITDIARLFHSTPFAALNDVSPIWLAIQPGTDLAVQAMKLCKEQRSGILISSDASPKTALLHAQRLLHMQCKSHGDALARFYDPAFWSALALTTAAHLLYGPWHSVHTPPAHRDDRQWRTWRRPQDLNDTPAANGYPLRLEDNTLAAARDIRWWYWVRARTSELTRTLPNEHLPVVLANLDLLVEHGIDEGRHLAPLLAQLSTRLLQQNPEIMNVLSSAMPAFEKVQRLENLI